MKTASTAAVTAVLIVSLSGCGKKTKTAPPPQAQAPVLPPSKMVYVPNLPALPPPSLWDVAVGTTPEENPEPVHPHKVARRKPSVAKSAPVTDPTTPTTPTADKPAPSTQTATGTDTAVSPIGQLSSTGETTNSQGRQDIERLIVDTENGLTGIKRTLSGEEQLTSTQIRTFLGKARQALNDNDLDGAQTLATKAKVLLEELVKK